MSEANQVARERADARIDQALGELRRAAGEIGKKHGIPDGIAGHSVEELLGRMAYIPSMARDLRRVAGQELAKDEMRLLFEGQAAQGAAAAGGFQAPPEIPPAHVVPAEPSKIPQNVPVGLDVGDLSGITVQAVKALRAAGLNQVGQVIGVPDEHLVKISGLGEKSVAQIRAAIAAASVPKPGTPT